MEALRPGTARVTKPVASRERSFVRGAAGSGWFCSRGPACSCSCEQLVCEAQHPLPGAAQTSRVPNRKRASLGWGITKRGVSSLSRYIFATLEWKYHRGTAPAGQAVRDGPTGLSPAAAPQGIRARGWMWFALKVGKGAESGAAGGSSASERELGEAGCARTTAG